MPIWPPAYRSATSAVDLARWPEKEGGGRTKCEVLLKDDELGDTNDVGKGCEVIIRCPSYFQFFSHIFFLSCFLVFL